MRGHYYKPLELDRFLERINAAHPLVGWGASAAADRAAPTLARARGSVDNVSRFHRGTRELARAVGQSPAQVGGDWWHGMADRERALAQLSSDFSAFAADVAANAMPSDSKWVASDALPLINAWRDFEKGERESTAILLATDWTTFERWLDKLRAARSNARARDFHLTSPEPADLPETLWDKAAEGTGGQAAALLGIAKLALAGGAALVGAVGVLTLVRDIRDRRKVKVKP